MIIATFRLTYEINDNEFATSTESRLFNENEPIENIIKWYESFNVIAKSHLEIKRIEQPKKL